MAINESYSANFEQILKAAENGDLCLLQCTDAATGKTVIAVCAAVLTHSGHVSITPLAKMFDGNPYEELIPPAGASPEAVSQSLLRVRQR